MKGKYWDYVHKIIYLWVSLRKTNNNEFNVRQGKSCNFHTLKKKSDEEDI